MGIREVPNNIDPVLRQFLRELREAVISVQPDKQPLRSVSNLQVTPIAGGNRIRFSASNGEGYKLLIGDSAEVTKAYPVTIGNISEYTDNVGKGGVMRYYWVVAVSNGKTDALPIGPMNGTTLSLVTETVLPTPPPPTDEWNDKK